MAVYQCSACGSWHDGAAYFASGAPRDPWGRVERSYRDDKTTPRYCAEECRGRAEAAAAELALVALSADDALAHSVRMVDGGDAIFGRTDDGWDDPRGAA